MKVINASVEVWPHNNEPLKHIERCGRLCYKSENSITDGSAEKFISNIVKREHLTVTEHFRFIFEIPYDDYTVLRNEPTKNMELSYNYSKNRCVVSASSRGLVELYECSKNRYTWLIIEEIIGEIVAAYNCQILFGDIRLRSNGGIKVLEISDLDEEEKEIHGWFTAHFICDRGVSHEIVRHRMAVYSQESTRYCNYSKDKFGNQITFIKPCYWEVSPQYAAWCDGCGYAEKKYFELLSLGAKPEEARGVLGNSLKTELAMTTTYRHWKHFFKLRCDSHAHPQAREVAIPLLKQAYELDNEMFKDIWEEYKNV